MSKSLNDKIAEIRNDFILSMPTRAAKIDSLVEKLVNGSWDIMPANSLLYEVHNLRGFCGGHGLMLIYELASKAEHILNALIEKNAPMSAADKQQLRDAIKLLANRMTYIYDHFEFATVKDTAVTMPTSLDAPRILIVDDDQHFCDTLAVQLEHFGYKTQRIHTLSELEQSINTVKPQAIFMDIIFEGNRDAGTQVIKELNDKIEISCPIIYLSARDDMKARLDAVRSGGSGFLCKTFSLADLKNALDWIVPIQKHSLFKVLIIDDDKVSTEFCSTILEHAGIQVSTLDKPAQVFESIINFDPDVILLDMYMPQINGFEMANVIRQHQSFSTIPIVIMSGETDVNKQFQMRRAGADDFLLKPFKPYHLVDTIINRIQRSRQTKRMIYTDGLTGLLIFSKVREQIVNMLESCTRYNLDFSLALIDLDHFKDVNDNYGHLVGDQILRGFAEFLLSRVRKSDMVTRSGGEEFTIIFPYTNSANALRALNSIREAFAAHMQHANGKDFKVTFSAGVASIEHYQDLESLIAAADQALYKSKQQGRNKIQGAD
jgi:diguanylate cyclase (GGDEF)-like protein